MGRSALSVASGLVLVVANSACTSGEQSFDVRQAGQMFPVESLSLLPGTQTKFDLSARRTTSYLLIPGVDRARVRDVEVTGWDPEVVDVGEGIGEFGIVVRAIAPGKTRLRIAGSVDGERTQVSLPVEVSGLQPRLHWVREPPSFVLAGVPVILGVDGPPGMSLSGWQPSCEDCTPAAWFDPGGYFVLWTPRKDTGTRPEELGEVHVLERADALEVACEDTVCWLVARAGSDRARLMTMAGGESDQFARGTILTPDVCTFSRELIEGNRTRETEVLLDPFHLRLIEGARSSMCRLGIEAVLGGQPYSTKFTVALSRSPSAGPSSP